MKKAYKRNSDYCMMSDAAVSSSSSNYEGKFASESSGNTTQLIWFFIIWTLYRVRTFCLNLEFISIFELIYNLCFKCATDDRNVREVTSRGICFRLSRYFVDTARIRELFLHSFGSVMASARHLLRYAELIIFFWLFPSAFPSAFSTITWAEVLIWRNLKQSVQPKLFGALNLWFV